MRAVPMVVLLLMLAGCGSGAMSVSIPGLTSPSFSEADVERTKETLRQQYAEQPGIQVLEVEMIRETPTRLTGFIKYRKKIFFSEREFSKQCSAVMGQDAQYLVRCG
jgi:hypothetical protein